MNSGNIALKTNLEYKAIICEAIDKFGGQQGKLIVPIEELKKNLAVVVYLIVSILMKNGEVAQLVRAQDS